MAKTKSHIEQFIALSAKAKANQVASIESGAHKGKPLTPGQRARWAKVQTSLRQQHAARGRPIIGKGVAVISLSVEKSLLKKADAQAKREGISRAALVARGLHAVLGQYTRSGGASA